MQNNPRKNSFKVYEDQSLVRLSECLEHYVPSGHLCRYVNEAVEQLDLSKLYNSYRGGGNSSYHPKLLLKCLLYGYLTQVYSSRRLEALMRENIMVMWLCCGTVIDHNTINNFRKGILKDHIDEIFRSVLHYLIGQQVIKLEQMHTDGTKIAANANRYTFVWAKSVSGYKAKLTDKISIALDHIHGLIAAQAAADEQVPMPPSGIDAVSLQAYIGQM